MNYIKLFGKKKNVLFLVKILVPIVIISVGVSIYGKKTFFAATSPWIQTDWSGGTFVGTVTSTVNTYVSQTDLDTTTTSGQFSLDTQANWSNDYSDWVYRRQLTFDNTDANIGTTAENLTNFPVLVKLQDGVNVDYSNTKDAGEDIRFTDSDGTVLDYEIEEWDESGTSIVWVKVPQIDINSDTDYIYMYYGNTSASDDQDASSVWSNGYAVVYHNNDLTTSTLEDSLGASNATKRTANEPIEVTGQIGKAQLYDGSNDYSKTNNNFVSSPSQLTISSWFQHTGDGNTYECALHKSTSSTIGTTDYWLGVDIDDRITATIGANRSGVGWSAGQTSNVAVDNTWYHVAASWDGNVVRVFIDGQYIKQYNLTSYGNLNAPTRMGSSSDGGNYQFKGVVDETRVSTAYRSDAWIAATYKSETDDFITYGSEDAKFSDEGVIVSNIFDAEFPADWGTLTYNSSGSGTVTVKVRTSNNSDMSGEPDFDSCSGISSGTDLTSTDCVDDIEQYLQYQVTLEPSGGSTPVFEDISIGFSPSDQVPPDVNASASEMYISDGGRQIPETDVDGNWNNSTEPYFSWTAGEDDDGGSGLKGYCLYLGTDSDGNPASTGGLLQNSPVSTTGSNCGFIVSGTNVDLSEGDYLSSALVSGTTYYFNIKAIDLGNNTYTGASEQFKFRHDGTNPTNVAYIAAPDINYGSVNDMTFTWPESGGSASSDTHSTVLGWQYQINSTSDGGWKGTDTSSELEIDYLPLGGSTYDHTLTEGDDGDDIITGDNIIYFRTVDNAGNFSSPATIRTASLAYGGAAPTFETACDLPTGITITPSTNTSNSFALSWDAATATGENTVSAYYYMINNTPPSQLSTLESNSTRYFSTTSTSVAATSLTGAVKGSNTIYVVAVDNEDNYAQSNCVKGTFTLDSSLPDAVQNLTAADSSIKSEEIWKASLTWEEPDYQGTGDLTYLVERSTDNSSWSEIGTTSGTSYTDTTPSSVVYYYRVGAYDSTAESQAAPTYSSSVAVLPKGAYLEAPSISSEPTVTGITTERATISWSTSRTSDTKVSYGTSSGDYYDEEPSKSEQVTSHEIVLTNLDPGKKYYYVVKFTDEDGNTGVSDEYTFTTDPAPDVKDIAVTNIGISGATLTFTVSNASSVKVYYGETTTFGGLSEISTSADESTYSINLVGLNDGTKYYYKINTFDEEDAEYVGQTLDFETLPRPRISGVTIQQIKGTAQPTILVSWSTNTEVSSIITYYPQSSPSDARDEVNVSLKSGEHRMLLRGLLPTTRYSMIVKGRDKVGNEAVSDTINFTTATDTRPPKISNLKIEGSVDALNSGDAGDEQLAQLIVSWNTDEAATSQVEFGEGTGTSYSQLTQLDTNLAYNHVVVISGLSPSKVYHLRALSRDEAGNEQASIDTVTITPKASDNALDLVIGNLSEAFGFLGGLR